VKLSRRKLSEYAAARLLKGDRSSVVMNELAAYLVETRRTRELELIVRDIEARLLSGGTALVTTVSARKLTDDAKHSIEKMVKAEHKEVKNIIMREQIDESVIGGVRIELPGSIADLTVRATLDKMTV
jgi:F-type H+-transporting ATPase subunit delta